jgi:hypothetical protein
MNDGICPNFTDSVPEVLRDVYGPVRVKNYPGGRIHVRVSGRPAVPEPTTCQCRKAVLLRVDACDLRNKQGETSEDP